MLNLRETLIEESFDQLSDTRLWLFKKFEDDTVSTEERTGALLSIIRVFYDRAFDAVSSRHKIEFDEYAGHWLKTHKDVVPDKVFSMLTDQYTLPDVSRIPENSVAFM